MRTSRGKKPTGKPTTHKLSLLSAAGLAALTSLGLSGTAHAQAGTEPGSSQDAEVQRVFNIPAQPLTSALTRFGQQSGLQVSVDGALIRDVQSPGVAGNLTPQEALTRLLAGTGLTYTFANANTVTLSPVRTAGEGPIEAGPLLIGGGVPTGRRSAAEDAPFVTPGSSAYISREQIERIQPSSPGDIFKEVPGVLSAGSTDGTSININIRSSQGLNRVRTMVEGTQQESSGYQGYAGADQRTYVDPELIGGVEITKGPGGGPYATGTTSGIVNIRLLDAEDLIQEGRQTGFRLRGGLGGNAVAPRFIPDEESFNPDEDADMGLLRDRNDLLTEDSWFGSFAGAYTTDRFDIVAAYARRKEGNYFSGENGSEIVIDRLDLGGGEFFDIERRRISPFDAGEEIANTSEDTESILLKGTLKLLDGQSVEAGYTYYESRFGQLFPSNINFWAPQQYRLSEVESNRYWLRYNWESANPLIDLQANLWGTNSTELGEIRQSPQETDAWGTEVWNTSFLETGLGELTVTAGAEYTRSESVAEGPTTISGTRYVRGQGSSRINELVSPAFDGSREVYGGYVNAALMPTDWLTLNAGLRYDGFKAEGLSLAALCDVDFTPVDEAAARRQQAWTDYIASFDTGDQAIIDAALQALEEANAAIQTAFLELDGYCGSAIVDTDNDGDRVSPRIGVTVEPLDGLQLFAQYSEGFRALSLVELGQTFNGPVTANPDLEPEVVKTWEVGVNYLRDDFFFQDDIFRGRLVYFNNDYDNFITRSGFVREQGIGTFFFFQNVPDVTVAGFEASLYYDVGWGFADFNGTHLTEIFDVPAQASIAQPEYSGTLTLGTRWLNDDLQVGTRLTYFSDSAFEPGTVLFWDAEEIVDLFGSYQLNDQLSVGFSVENVADTYYNPPNFISRIPSPGRTARVNFTATF